MKVRISKKLLKELPEAVGHQLLTLEDRYRTIKSVTIELRPAPFKLWLAEDSRYWHARAVDGEYVVSDGIQMVAEHNVGASGLRHEIGAEIPLQVGDFVFEVYYAGTAGYQLAMINVVEPQLAEVA